MDGSYTGLRALLNRHARLLSFGVVHAFASSPGQTFFIAMFAGFFATDLRIGVGALGTLYLVATLGSAACLPWLGHWIDRVDLRLFAGVATTGLGAACFFASSATSVAALAVAVFLLRLTGQGMMVHIEATATARYFRYNRGKALAVTALGVPLSEATMPALAVAMINLVGWRTTYGIIGFLILCVVLPISQMLLAHQPDFRRPSHLSDVGARPRLGEGINLLVRCRFFWFAIPLLFFSSFAFTALLFHISPIAEIKGWSLGLVATAFSAMAVSHVCGLFVSGPLVDRFTARRLLPVAAIPGFIGILLLAAIDNTWMLFALLALIGFSSALAKGPVSAVWAELFGVRHLGSIRSAVFAVVVVGSAAGPAAFGYALDVGLSLTTVLAVFALVGAGTIVVASMDFWDVPVRSK